MGDLFSDTSWVHKEFEKQDSESRRAQSERRREKEEEEERKKERDKKLTNEVKRLFKEQSDRGELESQVEEAFSSTLPQFELESGSVKIEKIDTTADKITGSLRYSIAGLNVNTPFIFKSKDSILILGQA